MKHALIAALLLPLMACGGGNQQAQTTSETVKDSTKNQVVKTIMTRRSIRQYKPEAVEREKMQIIVECGINAPNAMNRQPWEVRVVDNPDYINGVTELYKKANPKAAADSISEDALCISAYSSSFSINFLYNVSLLRHLYIAINSGLISFITVSG